MSIDIKLLLDQYWAKRRSKTSLYNAIDSEVDNWKTFIQKGLQTALAEKSDELLDDYLTLIFMYEIPFNSSISFLNEMLISSWHRQHENIALLLEEKCDASSIEYLYDAALTKFEYLEFDDNYALSVKCIWALGKILRKGFLPAKTKLELLTLSSNSIIMENAAKQLQMST